MLNDIKPILAIETSEKNCGVCLYFNSEKYFEYSFRMKNAHSEKIFELIEKIFSSSGISINETGCIAVSSGPGSFTGLRIGMSAAKGLAFGSSLPIIPVPTFEAMAMELCNFYQENTVFSISNKVNADEIYFAKFQVKSNNYIFVENLNIFKYSELKQNNDLIFGNALNKNQDNQTLFNYSAPRALWIAKWAEKFGSDLLNYNYDLLEPDYLKEIILKGMTK